MIHQAGPVPRLTQEDDKNPLVLSAPKGEYPALEVKVQLLLPGEGQDSTHLTGKRWLARAVSGDGIEATKTKRRWKDA